MSEFEIFIGLAFLLFIAIFILVVKDLKDTISILKKEVKKNHDYLNNIIWRHDDVIRLFSNRFEIQTKIDRAINQNMEKLIELIFLHKTLAENNDKIVSVSSDLQHSITGDALDVLVDYLGLEYEVNEEGELLSIHKKKQNKKSNGKSNKKDRRVKK